MSKVVDILERGEGLKDMPFGIPEGYLEGLSDLLLSAVSSQKRQGASAGRRHALWLAAAAAVAALIAAGTFFIRDYSDTGFEDMFSYELIQSDYLPYTDSESILYSQVEPDNGMTDEEIVDYLIYTGASAEEISSSINQGY